MFAQTAAALALVTAVLATSAVQAAEYRPASVQVQVSDIDLSTSAGHQRLMDRINTAASSVCSDHQSRRTGADDQAYRTCRAQAITAVTPQLHQLAAASHNLAQYAMTPHSESTAN